MKWQDWHAMYEQTDESTRFIVDEAYDRVAEELRKHKQPTAGDDRAEKLIAAIMEYVVESGN